MVSHKKRTSLWYCSVRYPSFSSLTFLALWRQYLLKSNFYLGSFLVSVFEKSSLATAIAHYFEKQVEGTPDGGKVRAAPSLEGIRGTLQACEDQTSAFDWRKLVVAVGTALGVTESKMYRTRAVPLLCTGC